MNCIHCGEVVADGRHNQSFCIGNLRAERDQLQAEVERCKLAHEPSFLGQRRLEDKITVLEAQVVTYKKALEEIAAEDQPLHDADPDCEYKQSSDCCNCTQRIASKALYGDAK